jgi:lambda repressor-like predicted transcriptional regulator
MLHVAYRSTMQVMSDKSADDRGWILGILSEKGWTATELARRASISQTTLTRFLYKPDHPFSLSERTREAIARANGLAPAVTVMAPRPAATGFYEPDAVEYEPDKSGNRQFDAYLQSWRASRPHVSPWVLRTSALMALGWCPGDILLVDLNASARPDDLVCAQIFDWPRNRAETVFRIYAPPFLLAGADQGRLVKPLMVDGENVALRGVVVASLRERPARPETRAA